MESRLKAELEALRRCRSDQILYLRATDQLLQTRRNADQTRIRQSFAQHEPLWALEEKWYKQFRYIRLIRQRKRWSKSDKQRFIGWLSPES